MAIKNYAETWQDIYAQYLGVINFVAGDFDSLKEVIKEYVVRQNQEQYTDWADSSEVGMMVNAISYVSSNINYRIDLNVHDLFPSTTKRRQSLLNFARLLSYAARRNIAANGIAKVVSVSTTQDIKDSMGNLLKNVEINWNDTVNSNWLEQFLTIMNSAFTYNNQYGKPIKTASISNIANQLYQINTISGTNYTLPFTAELDSGSYPFEVVNPDIDLDNSILYETTPISENAFNILYRNDGAGHSSKNTGFFVFWKQGTLIAENYQFDEKIENNKVEVSTENIDDNDVWVEEISNANGALISEWEQIASNEYLTYNNVKNSTKDIYKVETMENDKVRIKFSDGYFGNIPYGTFKILYRTTNSNDEIYIKPKNLTNIIVTIPYYNNIVSTDTNVYYLTLKFSVQDVSHIRQGVATQSLSSIKEMAPAVYSTQNRMVSSSDYNYFPKTIGQEVKILKSINRTFSGNSRYIKFNDPTGTYAPVNVLATDGYLYGSSAINISDLLIDTTVTSDDDKRQVAESILQKYVIDKFSTPAISNIYYEYYDGVTMPQYSLKVVQIMDNNNSKIYFDTTAELDIVVGDMLYLEKVDSESTVVGGVWVKVIQKITTEPGVASVLFIVNESLDVMYDWRLRGSSEEDGVISKLNAFNEVFNSDSKETMMEKLINGDEKSFFITYDPYDETATETESRGRWIAYTTDDLDDSESINSSLRNQKDITEDDFILYNEHKILNWFFKLTYNTPAGYWRIEDRSRTYVFGSKEEVYFFFNTRDKDSYGDFDSQDVIKVTSTNNIFGKDYFWKPYNVIKYIDDYVDPSKFLVKAYDDDKDTSIDAPIQFREMKEVTESSTNKSKKIIMMNIDEDTEDEYLDFTDLSAYPDGTATEADNSVNSTLWNHLEESGYYYMQHKCNKVYTTSEIVANKMLYSPKGRVHLSNGSVKDLTYGDIIDLSSTERKYTVVDCNIKTIYDTAAGTTLTYDDDGEGYLYYYDATSHELTFFSKDQYTIVEGMKDLTFLWKHMPNNDYTIDPCPTNIIDMFVLTKTYYDSVQEWISNGKKGTFPKAPSPSELKSTFVSLEKYKTISDTMVWNPVTYKLVFGEGADASNKCVFKAIKANDNISDNEVKQQVINLIDTYFKSMNVGETFYFTQLSTYIHSMIPNIIDSIVPVPTNNDEKFGTVFEITCDSDELLLSSATLDDVQVIEKMTSQILRSA